MQLWNSKDINDNKTLHKEKYGIIKLTLASSLTKEILNLSFSYYTISKMNKLFIS